MAFAQSIPGVSQFEQIAHHDSEHVPVSREDYITVYSSPEHKVLENCNSRQSLF